MPGFQRDATNERYRSSEPYDAHGRLISGLIAGLLAGSVMALFLLSAAALAGMKPMSPLVAIGSTFVPGGGALTMVVGLTVHLALSAVFGASIALVMPRGMPASSMTVLASGCGLGIAAIMASMVASAVNPEFRPEMQRIGGEWVIAHAVFGAVVGLVLARLEATRRLPRVSAAWREEARAH